MVICATLPSLRQFFRHVAPRLIGERSGGSSGNSSNTPTGLVTFGRSEPKKKYSKFNEDYALDTINDNSDAPYGVRTENNVDIEGGPREEKGTSADGESQKGILQTRTATVNYH